MGIIKNWKNRKSSNSRRVPLSKIKDGSYGTVNKIGSRYASYTVTTPRRVKTLREKWLAKLKGHDWTWWLSRMAVLFFAMIILGLVSVLGLFGYYSRGLPDPNSIIRKDGFATRIMDRNGELLYEVYADEKRIPVKIENVPTSLKLATIAVEDKDFYNHPGFDIKGIMRGGLRLFTRGRAQGGSTLTQQLVKNSLLTSERSISRKIREFVLSVEIERRFDKDQILQMYLNEAPYGGTAWGIGAASETYFGKNVSELTLLESAVLAGLPQSPTSYSPFGSNPDAYVTRTQAVLRRMNEDGYLSNDEYKASLEMLPEMQFKSDTSGLKAGHFVMYVKDVLEERYGQDVVERGGLRVTTTLDLELQNKAQEIVSDEIKKVIPSNITNGASVVMDPKTGEILAMIGSRGYDDPDYDGKVNVTLRPRQPGSSIKPLTYLTALRKGYTPATLLMDVPTEFPGGIGNPPYRPNNYDGKFRGPVLMREALGNSLNIPAVKMLALVGIKDMMTLGYDMGFETLEPTKENMSKFGLSLTLGGGEVTLLNMVSSYSAIANGGHKVEPVSVLKVEDRNGKLLEEFQEQEGEAVVSPQEAWLLTNILSDNNARAATFGVRNSLVIPNRTVAAKTGTTNSKRDNWTVGWSPSYVVGVWVGNNDNSEMSKLVSGVTGAAPIWRQVMINALEGTPNEEFPQPDGIVEMDIDALSGYPAHNDFPSKKEFFIKGTEPSGEDPIHAMIKVCKGDTSKLANAVLISNNDYEEKEFFVFKEKDPLMVDGVNKWQEGIDAWLANPERQSDGRYKFPTEYCNVGGDLGVRITEPGNESRINSNQVTIKATAVSIKGIRKVEFEVDGKLYNSFNGTPYEDTITLSDGPHTIKVRAIDEDNSETSAEVKIGVNSDWNPSPTPSPSPTESPSPTVTIKLMPTISILSPTP